MRKPKIDILTYDEYKKEYTSGILSKEEKIIITDLVSLCADDGHLTKTETNSTHMKTIYNDDISLYNPKTLNGIIHKYDVCGIRPVITNYHKIEMDILSKKVNEDGIIEVEYGYYPQWCVNQELYQELYNYLITSGIKDGNNKYHTRLGQNWHVIYEFIYNNKRYATSRLSMMIDFKSYGRLLSNGDTITDDKLYIFKVEPIKWLVDLDKNIAISKYVLCNSNCYLLKDYLDDYFSKEILQVKEEYYEESVSNIENKTNKKTDEVSNILDEIDKYLKYYHGNIDIKNKIDILIDKYNTDIDALYDNKEIILL